MTDATPRTPEGAAGAEEAAALEGWLKDQLEARSARDAAWQQHRLQRRRLLSVNYDAITRPPEARR